MAEASHSSTPAQLHFPASQAGAALAKALRNKAEGHWPPLWWKAVAMRPAAAAETPGREAEGVCQGHKSGPYMCQTVPAEPLPPLQLQGLLSSFFFVSFYTERSLLTSMLTSAPITVSVPLALNSLL